MRRRCASGRRRQPVAGAVAACALAVGLTVFAPPAAARGQRVDLRIGISSLYDDNLLQYSDEQLAVFESGLKPAQFSIETSDDLLLGPSASLTWSNQMGRGRSRSLRLRWTGEFHKENATADFTSYSATWRESFSRDWRLTLYGYWLPRFFLRQLYDEDVIPPYPGLSKYRRAEFDLAIGSVTWRQRITGKTRAQIGYRYEHRGYNPDFEERTSSSHQGELAFEAYRLPSRGALGIYGAYRVSDAREADADSAADPDVSYHGIVAGLGWRMELARAKSWRLGADLGYELGTRGYESNLPSDKYHYNRNDISNTVDVGLRWTLRPHWGLRGFYRFDTNSAELGALAPPGSETGSYTENQVGLSLEWSGTIWRQSDGADDGDQE